MKNKKWPTLTTKILNDPEYHCRQIDVIKLETEEAVLVVSGEFEFWLPKSVVKFGSYMEQNYAVIPNYIEENK